VRGKENHPMSIIGSKWEAMRRGGNKKSVGKREKNEKKQGEK
jgi:hypothetical protein